ncbi:DUF4377 domain-containing protein [Psychrobacter sp. FDAARGOS_221]|uniref:DUF4377 domain-containing protein n=1 Tax=Psychrobacter sp. FDAARGOS_221 TaxID=1975705 RepID=UPI000BB59065|nr:DUF4377 domain-containing protein [Psychrobacter sp. FDAARGOS_221]PNK59524.1 DUF4377 domain-containing protein [Psychrobacter sp. FDAARGOS_221]
MKYLLSSLALASLVLTACTTTTTSSTSQMRGAVKTAQSQAASQIIHIPSFLIEVSPQKAPCEIATTEGSSVRTQCLYYRQTFQKNYNTLSGGIKDFDFEPGYRYILDIRQDAVADDVTGQLRPLWTLNKVVSKIKE